MEEEATQPATQIVVDPRRLGQGNSGLSDEDLADICCIIYPTSLPAYRAFSLIHDKTPEYTITSEIEVPIREKTSQHDAVDTFELAAAGVTSCALVLRLSAKLKDPVAGFYFGRNSQRCDFVIGQNDQSRRISNTHFRIYINEFGVIMLEDQSTNGTAVDGVLLRGKEKDKKLDYRHTLESGSVITLTMTPPEQDYRFLVYKPQRDLEADRAYEQNLTAFFLRMHTKKQEIEARADPGGAVRKPGDPVNLFPAAGRTTPNASNLSSVGRYVREWRGGPKYNRVGCIGKGAFATVYQITAKFDGVPYAAKELEKRRFMKNGVLDQKVDSEMNIMSKIMHPNIVQYVEHIDWDDYLYIIMEFVPNGDLGSMISKCGHLPELDVKCMAVQLLSALKYLHEQGITHRDIKPDNILISSTEPFQVKLTDFGLSKMIDSEETFLRTFCGTLLYCAPEVYSEYREYDHTGKRNLRGVDKKSLPPQRYGNAVDIWSLAGVLFYALCGKPPYPVQNGTSYQELLNRIMTEPLDIRPLQRAGISEPGIRFVRRMLHTDPRYRATIEDLEKSSWLIGGDSMEMSQEDDEVDMVGDGHVDPELEAGTSQLSINPDDREINDSADMDDNMSELTEMQREREIPNSYSTGNDSNEDNSNGTESYGFLNNDAAAGNGRLFGEVNISAVGSSGAIPVDQLNLPLPTRHLLSNLSDSSRDTESEFGDNLNNRFTTQPISAVAPPIAFAMEPPPALNTDRHPEIDERAIRSSSLMGAESMVGNFHVHSPASAASPSADSPTPTTEATTEDVRESIISLRRPREEDDDDDNLSWLPIDLPPKKKIKSSRHIELDVPAKIFWDPKDKSTHHYNYPRMTTTDFAALQKYAESKGERFTAGHKTFEMTMQSFRTSRSPSFEPERAHSEPDKEDGRRMLMMRDERSLSDASTDRASNRSDDFLPSTARPSVAAPSVKAEAPAPSIIPQPVVGNDFQPPKRILAKLIGTSDSCLPTVTLNITDPITSWGRGYEATVRYSNGNEIRIPKYAFKIMLFKPGYYAAHPNATRNGHVWKDADQDMEFYISTKAAVGIWINGILLPSHNKIPAARSVSWAELRNGDRITVWRQDNLPSHHTTFRFEGLWGKSKQVRKQGEPIRLVEDPAILSELEECCLTQEGEILADIRRRLAEEELAAMKMKEEERSARQSAPPLTFQG